ncbi:MAG TPA: TIGR02646 family protein, partial [Chloroflexota bacterium]|nr:TIGR02646 family protein [Chloroflexota bacterium]
DSYKGNLALSRNPADPAHRVEALLQYLPDGSVMSPDNRFNRELEKVLNLNLPLLRNNRKAVLDALKESLQGKPPLKAADLKRMIGDWSGRSGAGEFREYCEVVVYWLNKRLARV